MAGTGGDKLPAAKCNQVQQEQIWKDYVHHEDVAAKRWLTTWGFLCDEYSKMTSDIKATRQGKAPALKLPPVSTGSARVSNVPFVPQTTTQEIGWRSTRRDCNLEIYGRWGRPKRSILNHFNWTIYACD
jgi:hypothetical protein